MPDGKIERPFRYIRQDFFLARTFRNIDDLNAQFDDWRREVANPRIHATTGRVVDAAFAEEADHLQPLPGDGTSLIIRRLSGCAAPVVVYEIVGGEHTWPGGADIERPLIRRLVGRTSREVDAGAAALRLWLSR